MATVIRSGIDATLATVDPATNALQVKLSGTNYVDINPGSISMDASGRTRVSQLTTLHDGKILNGDNVLIWSNKGTGTGTYANNKYNMSVTSGQYFIKQSKRFSPYSAGKSQFIECTFDNFQIEANTTKRVGYFSSGTASTYNDNYDGIFLENDGTTYRLRAYRNGTSTLNIPWTSWDNYNLISTYNWSNFTVVAFDFLWLGGAVLRFFIKTVDGFILAHTFNYSGTTTDVFIASPNQPIRYELRSTTGTGSLRYICSQVSTEGSINESGYNLAVVSGSQTSYSNIVATIGTTYPVLGIRKKAGFRDNSVKFTGISINVQSNADVLLWSVQLNPTLSSALTYVTVPNSLGVEYGDNAAVNTITNTVTTPGRIIANGVASVSDNINVSLFETDFLSYLGCDLDNIMDTIVLCVTPITAGITLTTTISMKEY